MALVAVRKGMDYLFSQHDLSFLDDVIPEKDKKKKEDEKKKKKKKGSLDSDNDDVRNFAEFPIKLVRKTEVKHALLFYCSKEETLSYRKCLPGTMTNHSSLLHLSCCYLFLQFSEVLL